MFSYFILMKTLTTLYFVPQHMRVAIDGGVCGELRRQVRVT
jgi:hypothetical protein